MSARDGLFGPTLAREALCLPSPSRSASSSGICPQCEVPMEIQGDEYVCPQCKRIIGCTEKHISSEPQNFSDRKISRARYYSSSSRSRDVYSVVCEHLLARRDAFIGALAKREGREYTPGSSLVSETGLYSNAPSSDDLLRAARIYCEMRARATAENRVFPLVGDARDELLAAIVFHECNKTEQYKRADIAAMMMLRSDGFARGWELLTSLAAANYFAMDSDSQVCRNRACYYHSRIIRPHLAEQYATIADPIAREQTIEAIANNQIAFIFETLTFADEHNIGSQSQLASKIVGAIWFIVQAMHYPIPPSVIDERSGGIKKGTFSKFTREIQDNEPIMEIARAHSLARV